MKKVIIIVLIIFLNLFKTRANSDSLTYKIDSIYITGVNEINDSTFEKHKECLDYKPNLKEVKQTNNLKEDKIVKLESKSKPENWFSDAWDTFTDLFKPVWGLYTEDGYRQEGPYFLFMNNYNKLNL
ncbi:MAG: hypothetical protein ACEQSR_00500 [Candidatus Methylacidiphilales bacterium]